VKNRIEFPLFETVLIIILLSVLAIIAFPKFENIGVEARIGALNATVLNLNTLNRLLYSRSVIKGIQDNALQETDIFDTESAGAYLVYGELRAEKEDLKLFLESDLIVYGKGHHLGEVRLYLDSYKNSGCYVEYRQAEKIILPDGQTSIQKATYKVKSSGC